MKLPTGFEFLPAGKARLEKLRKAARASLSPSVRAKLMKSPRGRRLAAAIWGDEKPEPSQ